MASIPTPSKSFTSKNAGDTIQPTHVNDLQDEVNAIEAGLLNGTANLNSSNSTLANLSVTGGSTFSGPVQSSNSTVVNLSVTGNSTIAGSLTVGGTFTPGALAPTGVVTANSQPRAHVYNSATQNVENNAETNLTFNTAEFNVGSSAMWSSSVNPTRMTFQSTGLFLVGAKVVFPAGGTGNRYLRFEKTSGSTASLGSRVSAPPDGSNFGSADPVALANVVPVQVTSTGDYVQAVVFQTQGSSVLTGSATRNLANEMWAVKLW
jgi:hypothetical protein